jgi:hypothetical protein
MVSQMFARTYAFFLAGFVPGLTKVGLTATERGTDCFAEQAVLAFTWVVHGRPPAVHGIHQVDDRLVIGVSVGLALPRGGSSPYKGLFAGEIE